MIIDLTVLGTLANRLRLAIPIRLGSPDNVVDFGPKSKCCPAAFLTRLLYPTGILMGSFVKMLTSVRKANPVRLCFLPAFPRRLGSLWVFFAFLKVHGSR